MILAIIFLVLFLAFAGVGIYFSISLVKSPISEIDYKKPIIRNLLLNAGSAVSFLVASFGFYQWLNASPDALHVVQLVIGALLFAFCLFTAINAFTIHYYRKGIPEKLDNWLFRIIIIGFVLALISLFVWTNGLAPYLTYPLWNGFSFKEFRFVSPDDTVSPNIAFYALCILSGAGLVYFICDHYMYKEYGKHGILESTFFVAFPAGIIGARLWYVVGNWKKEFANEPFWKVFAIWEGGLTILGGAIMGIVVGVLFFIWRNKGKSIWFAVDMIVPTILIAQAIGRWGNFFNCEVHGLVDDLSHWKWLPEIIWRNAQFSSTGGLAPDGSLYIPLFFIECVSNLFGYFLIAHVFGRALKKILEPGDLCFGYVIWYGLTRVLMEPLRSAEFQMGENGYWSWVWSMLFVLIGTLLIVVNHIVRYILKKKKNTLEVKPYDKNLGLFGSVGLLLVGGALTVVGAILMTSNEFKTIVCYNNFNIGLIVLVCGVSILLVLSLSLLTLIAALKNKPVEAVEEQHENL